MSDPRTAPHETHMRRALQLAERGLYTTDPNPRVGCVIAQGAEVVAEGWHMRAGEPHAEVLALRAAGERARGASVYVTLEPCSHVGRTGPCADALLAAGVAAVHCCTADPNPEVAGAGIERLRSAGVEVACGLLAAPARALNAGFFSRFERRRPFIRLKMAMTLDGRTAPADRSRRWISGEAARGDVQHWRARSSAILTGSGTVRSDDPRLDVRLAYGPWIRQPLRVVLDTGLSCNPSAQVFRNGSALVFAADSADPAGTAAAAYAAQGIAVERVAPSAEGLDLGAVLQRLAELQVNEVLLECGATLAGSFMARQLIDEILLYVSAGVLGEDAAPLLRLSGLPADAAQFEFVDVQRVGQDVRLTLAAKQD